MIAHQRPYLLFALALLAAACGSDGSSGAPGLIRETEHFSIRYAESDAESIDDIVEHLEAGQKRIGEDLQHGLDFQVRVTVYPDIAAYHLAMGDPGASDGFIGQTNGAGEIQIVSPRRPGTVHTYDSVMKALVHELAHAMLVRGLGKGLGELPLWVHEATAMWEAEQMDAAARRIIAEGVAAKRVPSFASFGSDSYTFASAGGYTWSYTIAEFVVNTYGLEALRRWIASDADFEAAFGLSEDGFRAAWIAYLEAQY